ncbi:MAG: ATP-binding protein [Nocardioides sp.]
MPHQLRPGPRTPLGHLARLDRALASADDVDDVTRSVLGDLLCLPGVRRVGLALSEGGGRRLRFTASDRATNERLDWCHIDAYDDVPLTAVVRTGAPILAALDDLDACYAGLVATQRGESTVGLAAMPLPGTGSPIGGLVLFFDAPQPFDDVQWRLLEAVARAVSEALQRLREAQGREPSPVAEPALPEGARAARCTLAGDPRAAGEARRFLRRELADWQVAEDPADTALLCLSELVTNAVVHAGAPSELVVTLEGEVLTIVVRDRGGSGLADGADLAQPVADPDPLRVHGRGLMLVDAMVDRWGSERDVSGTTVWFVLELEENPAAQQTG